MPPVGCGIDFGTSNSALALAQRGGAELVALEAGQATMPSAVFFNEDEKRPSFGRAALTEYRDGYSGRLLRSLKSILGSDLIGEATQVGNRRLPFRDIIGLYLGHLKKTGEAAAGKNLDQVVLGRPVFFVDDDPAADARAQSELEGIARMQGFREVSFEYEPLAAARDYESRIEKEELVLIADIGGGTSDFSVIRLSPDGRGRSDRSGDILGNSGVHIGGTDFDRQFSLQSVMPHMGYKTMLQRGLAMPMNFYVMLSTWHLINQLYIQKNIIAIRSLRQEAMERHLVERLIATVEKQRGHEVASRVEEAKIELSDAKKIRMDLGFIEDGWSLPLGRKDLAQAIARDMAKIHNTALKTVRDAGLDPERIQTLFLTGGSTGLPGFEAGLQSLFPGARIAYGDRFSSVASGLGLAAAERYA